MNSSRLCLVLLLASLFPVPPLIAQTFTSSVVEAGRASIGTDYLSAAVVDGKPAVCFYDSTRGVVYARNSAVDGSGTWTSAVVQAVSGADTSLAVVDGKPAICFAASGQLRYSRNSLADGSGTWTTTVVETSTLSSGFGTSLAVVDGKPAISYYNATNGDLRFAINSAADGSGAWTKSNVDTGNGVDVTVFTGRHSSLKVVDGRPAISYHDSTNSDLKFARNSAADGSGAWTITTVLGTGFVGHDTSLAIVDGRPAISFLSNNGSALSFAINSAIDGTGTWTITTVQASSLAQGYASTSLAVVGGVPVIGYYTFSGPRFARNSAADATGAWALANPAPGAVVTSSIGPYPVVLELDARPFMVCADYNTNDVRIMRNSLADASGTWTNTFLENTGTVGAYSSATLVSGNPAIAYYDARLEDLKFARNSAVDGSGTWTVSTVDEAGDVGEFACLAIVDGRPAISYFDDTNDDLKFAINSAADGSGAWTVTTVESASSTGQLPSLAVVNGKPAISYSHVTNADLKFAINSAADGSGSWSLSTIDASVSSSIPSSLAVVDGNPAVAYSATGGLKFARNAAADGSGAWTVVIADSASPSTFTYKSLAVIAGKPAIAYMENFNGDVKYASNSAADGSGTWTQAIVDTNGGDYMSLKQVGGKPSITYTSGNIKLARNSAASGLGDWAVTDTFISGSYGSQVELASGQPAFSLFDGFSLRWARLSSTSFPEIEMEQPPQGTTTFTTPLSNGSSISYGTLPLGSNKTITLLVKNVGTAPLTLSAPTLLGSHPGDYSVSAASVPASLPPLEGALFTVTFTPTAGGIRSATLRITNNDANEATTNLNLSGTCLLFTQDTDGDGLSDAAEFNMSALGFNASSNQSTTLVPALFNNANSVGLFTPSQVQALNIGTPLLQRNPLTGVFTLTIGVEKSTTLAPASFGPFPMTAPQTTINGAGELEFQFTVPDNAAFFQLRAE